MGFFDLLKGKAKAPDPFVEHMMAERAEANIWANIEKIEPLMYKKILPSDDSLVIDEVKMFARQRALIAVCFIFHRKMLLMNAAYMSHPLYMSIQMRMSKKIEKYMFDGEKIGGHPRQSADIIKDASIRCGAEAQIMLMESQNKGFSFQPLADNYLGVGITNFGDCEKHDTDMELVFKAFAEEIDQIWLENNR